MPPTPLPVRSKSDIEQFFDRFAAHNIEHHGAAGRLLRYRLSVIDAHIDIRPNDVVLDVGCGNGHHLFALDGRFARGVGVDLSAAMVASARAAAARTPRRSAFEFARDDAETLATLPDASVDVVVCIGAIEHMADKLAVFCAARRVLRPGGRFVCLTLNDRWLWYHQVAPALGYETRHLASDRRLDAFEALSLMKKADFHDPRTAYWTFIPAGDMPELFHGLFRVLDVVGRLLGIPALRGGLVVTGQVHRVPVR
jgi:ubiquinone/menaquinone biosynthesis C-methylase UbiE